LTTTTALATTGTAARRLRAAVLPALLAALPVIAYAPAWWEGRLLGPGDGAALHFPLRAAVWASWRDGDLPAWNPGIFLGTPLLASYRPGALFPLMPLLALLPPFAWRAGAIDWSAGSFASWTAVAYLAFAVSSLGYLLWYWALARGGIARIGTLQFLQPVASLVLAVLLLSEPMTLPLAACAALVLAGTIFAHRG